MRRVKGLSGVVVTYNRRDVVETCLSAARLCEELIVVDKGSTDGTAEIARKMADRFVTVPWTPTVEGTREQAVALASHDWILLLDDDECLNVEALRHIAAAVEQPPAPICYIPIRHYVMGRHDPAAYYWPEYRPSLFRRGALEFSDRVHGGIRAMTPDVYHVPYDQGPAIEHLSHATAAVWIEKTNRYTSQPERAGNASVEDISPAGIVELMQAFLSKVPEGDSGYLTAAAALRGVYDVIDAVKRWEETQPIDGREAFSRRCADLQRDYERFFAD